MRWAIIIAICLLFFQSKQVSCQEKIYLDASERFLGYKNYFDELLFQSTIYNKSFSNDDFYIHADSSLIKRVKSLYPSNNIYGSYLDIKNDITENKLKDSILPSIDYINTDFSNVFSSQKKHFKNVDNRVDSLLENTISNRKNNIKEYIEAKRQEISNLKNRFIDSSLINIDTAHYKNKINDLSNRISIDSAKIKSLASDSIIINKVESNMENMLSSYMDNGEVDGEKLNSVISVDDQEFSDFQLQNPEIYDKQEVKRLERSFTENELEEELNELNELTGEDFNANNFNKQLPSLEGKDVIDNDLTLENSILDINYDLYSEEQWRLLDSLSLLEGDLEKYKEKLKSDQLKEIEVKRPVGFPPPGVFGELIMGYANGENDLLSLSPNVGYHINKYVDAGIGVEFFFSEKFDPTITYKLFTRISPIPENLYLHFETNSYMSKWSHPFGEGVPGRNDIETAVLGGIGFNIKINDQISINSNLLRNLNDSYIGEQYQPEWLLRMGLRIIKDKTRYPETNDELLNRLQNH